MKAPQIKDLCIEGSNRIYDYVSKRKNGGAQEIAVTEIECIDQQEFKFKLSRTIFDLDSISFLFSDVERRYFESDEISIVVYDHEQRFVIINTSLEVADLIEQSLAYPQAWKLTFDLKFLIKRVIEWYEANGDELSFIDGRPASRLNFDSALISNNSAPSSEQLSAINTCFDQPLSYIWGAPGTGKTRFVLSYALLSYLKNEAKTLILAPTNLALEQIFTGVISVIEREQIDRKQLLRLGTPTKAFATEYAEVCEEKGIDVKLAQLKRQVEILESIKSIDELDKPNLEAMLSELQWLDKRQKLVSVTDAKLAKLKREINSAEKNRSALANSIKAHKKAIENAKENTTKLATIRASEQSLVAKLAQINRKLDDNKARYKSLDDDVASLRNIVIKRQNKVKELAKNIEVSSSQKAIELSLSSITKLSSDAQSNRARLFSMAQEYEQFAESEMENKLKQYKTDISSLKLRSTDVRLKAAGVIGMTLDSYMARTKEKPIQFDHVFIDEAGYASLVKVLPVFASNVPITLLGDHKQLPPVCEMGRDDILKIDANNAAFLWDSSAVECESIWQAASLESAVDNYRQQTPPNFSRLKRNALTTSYRFGKKLAAVLHQHVYSEEGFYSGLFNDTQISIFNVNNRAHLGEHDIGRRANMAEAMCVLKIIDSGLIESALSNADNSKAEACNGDFAVLTPYRDQVALFAKLRPELAEQDRVLTVHKSQGREWHTVIYNVCDIGNGAQPWFTDSGNAMSGGLSNVNTAVSRAKKHLIIVCDSNAWQQKSDQLICGLIQARTKRYQYQA